MINILKVKANCQIIHSRVPKIVWVFRLIREAEIYSRSSEKDGKTPVKILTGDTIDISEWTEFYFYKFMMVLG